MSLHDYRFRNVWSLQVAARHVFHAVIDLDSYPLWWPDIRSVRRVDDDTAELTCRALLPYSLVFRMHRAEQDEPTGRMRVAITGDLEGYCQGVVAPEHPGAARLEISQRVVLTKPLLRRLAPVARPLFRINHAAMMFRGQRGLRRYLLGATAPPPA